MPATTPYLANPAVGRLGQKTEIVSSTPHKFELGVPSPESYFFADGFYQSTKYNTTHPVVELQKNEQLKKWFVWKKAYFAALPNLEESQSQIALDVWLEIGILLSELQASQIVFELTNEGSVLCKAIVNSPNNSPYQLFLAIYFDQTEVAGYEAILNIFQEKQQKMAASGDFAGLKKRIISFFSIVPVSQAIA